MRFVAAERIEEVLDVALAGSEAAAPTVAGHVPRAASSR
jgi:hypothetical protein